MRETGQERESTEEEKKRGGGEEETEGREKDEERKAQMKEGRGRERKVLKERKTPSLVNSDA